MVDIDMRDKAYCFVLSMDNNEVHGI